MKKTLKIIGIAILFLFALLIILPIAFKGKILEEAKRQINNNINAKVDFESIDIGIIRSFPNLNLMLENVVVTNGAEFDSVQLLNVQKIQINLNLMSIIKGEKYVINKILLASPTILAKINKQGKANWDIAKTTDTIKKEVVKDTTPSKFSLALKSLSITNANLVFDDQKGNSYYETKNLNYDLSGDLSDELTTLKNELSIDETSAKFAGVKYLSKAKISVDATVEADLKNEKYTLHKNTFKINALELRLDGSVQMFKNAMDINLKFGMPNISFKNLLSLVPALYTSSFKEMQANGSVNFNGWLKGKKDSTKMPAFAFNLNIDKANFKYPSLPKSVDDINVKVSVQNPDGVLDHTSIDLNQFHVALAQNIIDAKAAITKPISDPSIDLTLNGKVDLASVKDFVPLPDDSKLIGILDANIKLLGSKSMVDKKQYDKFKAEGLLTIKDVVYNTKMVKEAISIKLISFAFSPKRISLNDFDAKIGASDFKANGTIANFLEYVFKKDSNLVGSFNFHSDYLNVNQFMTADSTPKKEAEKSTTAMSVVEIPKNVDFVLSTNIKRVLYDKMVIENIAGQIIIRNQQALMNNLSMNLLDGNMKLNGNYNTQNKRKPSISFDMAIQHFDIQKTAQTFNTIEKINPFVKECFGAISCQFNLKSLLTDTMTPVMMSILAKGKFNTHNLKLQGENMNKLSELFKNNGLKELNMKDVEARFEMKDGKLNIDTCTIDIQNIKGKFAGMYALDQTMSAGLHILVPFSLLKEKIITPEVETVLQQAKNNDIPITIPEYIPAIVMIKGKSTKPEYGFSFDKALFANLKDEIRKGVEAKLNKEKERLINEGKKKLEQEKEKLMNEGKKKLEQEKDKLIEKGKDELKKWIPKF